MMSPFSLQIGIAPDSSAAVNCLITRLARKGPEPVANMTGLRESS